jgi:hypothetical protein
MATITFSWASSNSIWYAPSLLTNAYALWGTQSSVTVGDGTWTHAFTMPLLPARPAPQPRPVAPPAPRPPDYPAQDPRHPLLSDAETAQLLARHEITVPSHYRRQHNRLYRIPCSSGAFVKVVEDGRVIDELCLQPNCSLRSVHWLVMQKLLIEADELEYLKRANHIRFDWRHHADLANRRAALLRERQEQEQQQEVRAARRQQERARRMARQAA